VGLGGGEALWRGTFHRTVAGFAMLAYLKVFSQ
jgi:hypothetical protein